MKLHDYAKLLQASAAMGDSAAARGFINAPVAHACNCIGPQNGLPRCPCAMRGVVVKNGRYVQVEVDLGPAGPIEGEGV